MQFQLWRARVCCLISTHICFPQTKVYLKLALLFPCLAPTLFVPLPSLPFSLPPPLPPPVPLPGLTLLFPLFFFPSYPLPLPVKEYTDELNHLLTIAKHPKTVEILRNALSGAQLPLESSKPAQNGSSSEPRATATDQTITVQPISTLTQSKETLVHPTTKISQYGECSHCMCVCICFLRGRNYPRPLKVPSLIYHCVSPYSLPLWFYTLLHINGINVAWLT